MFRGIQRFTDDGRCIPEAQVISKIKTTTTAEKEIPQDDEKCSEGDFQPEKKKNAILY